MKKINLNKSEIKYILSSIPLKGFLRTKLNEHREGGGILSDDEADLLRDLCGDRLETHGFNLDYSLTREGEILERLIDKLFVEESADE